MTNGASKFKPNRKLDEGDSHVENTDQIYITTTEDKIEICARDFIEATKARHSWTGPAGIALAIVITLTTATFEDKFGLSASTIKAIFIVSLLVAIGFLVKSIFTINENWEKGSSEHFIKRVRGRSDDN